MIASRNMDMEKLMQLATGRTIEMFAQDLQTHEEELRGQICKSRILVIGGAGTIGSATIRSLVRYNPKTLHVVDQNENSLAELVRDLRSCQSRFVVADFKALPLDFGSPLMGKFLTNSEPYDYVLNFAALKHVRSEKDVYSSMQILDTNVLKQFRLLRWLADRNCKNYFSVSTDKAANPVNLMGASKRIMEHVMFSNVVPLNGLSSITSARFANVAFSDGSILYSLLRRIEKRQPCVVPRGIRRFFITQKEAGIICLLGAFATPSKHILIPRLDQEKDLRELVPIAVGIIKHLGLNAQVFSNEAQAKEELTSMFDRGQYPLLVTEPDTTGEKPYEEFVGKGENAVEIGFRDLEAVEYRPVQMAILHEFLERIEEDLCRDDHNLSKENLLALVSGVVPSFQHIETGNYLDSRM